MTTGSITTGPRLITDHIHYAKEWQGGDGSTITTRYSSYPKWNVYTMASARFRSGNPNKLGRRVPPTNPITYVTNHAWAALGTSVPGLTGYSGIRADGTVNSTWPASLFSQIWGANEESALLAKLLKKIKGHELNLGPSLAEVDKLATTVHSTIKNIVYGVNDLKHLRFSQFARRFGARPPSKKRVEKLRTSDIPARFLEMRYAWEPTIKDAYEAAKAFEQISKGPKQTYNRATRRRKISGTYRTNYCTVPQVAEAQRTYLFEMYEEMSFARQIGLANPLEIVWERLPWSFVIDWFIPIGTYLELIGQIPFLKGRWCRTSSIRWKTAGTFKLDVAGQTPELPYVDVDWERFHLERVITFSFPSVPFPKIKVFGAIHGKRIGNAIALASQIVSKLAGGRDGVDDYVPDVDISNL